MFCWAPVSSSPSSVASAIGTSMSAPVSTSMVFGSFLACSLTCPFLIAETPITAAILTKVPIRSLRIFFLFLFSSFFSFSSLLNTSSFSPVCGSILPFLPNMYLTLFWLSLISSLSVCGSILDNFSPAASLAARAIFSSFSLSACTLLFCLFRRS